MGFNPPPTIRSGPWAIDDIERFLAQTAIPVRLASNGQGFPLVQSQWFLYEDGGLWCCAKADSVLAKRLDRDPRCAFEVSGDLPPYSGVRGTGRATQHAKEASRVLPLLIERYLGDTPSPLADWLLSRLDVEVAIRISDLSVTSWDYSARMTAPADRRG
ncbi:MAG: pyridoxamine 5'-phosphate oxidase family protein [Actinobacteria bacterium]|nr:pyridoxamine 5'-phosphate oxidase family protein [Actinomycetota bacterium]